MLIRLMIVTGKKTKMGDVDPALAPQSRFAI